MDKFPIWYAPTKIFFKALMKIFFRLEVRNEERFPLDGPVVLACNHVSNADPPLVGVACPRKVNIMAKEELFVPVIGAIFRFLGAFPVRRGGADRTAIRRGIDILKNGECLIIFPEGTRSRTGQLGKAQPGALMMASKTRATIVPTCIVGTDFVREKRWWPKVVVSFAEPIFFPEGDVNKEVLHSMTDEMMRRIGAEIELVKSAR